MFRRKNNLPTETPVLNKDTGVFENRRIDNPKQEKKERKKQGRKDRKAARKASMAQRRWSTIVIVINILLLVVMTVECIYSSSMLIFLKNQNAYILDTTNVSLTEIATMKADIEATLEQENSLLESWKIELTDTDFSRERYTVHVEVIPKEYTDNTETFIYFGTNEFELKREGFVYAGYASLPLTESFNGNVTVLFVDGNKRSTEVMKNFSGVNENFEEVLSGSLSHSPVYKDNSLKFNANCEVKLDSKKYYNFEQFNLVVEVDGEEAALYELGKLNEDSTSIAEVRIKDEDEAVADNLNQPTIPEMEDEASITEQADESTGIEAESEVTTLKDREGTYNWSDIVELEQSEDMTVGRKVRIYLRASCQEGYTFTYDLFNGTTNVSATENAMPEGFEESDNYYISNAKVKDLKGGEYSIQATNTDNDKPSKKQNK